MSICRHPVIVVDSDLKTSPSVGHGPDKYLKKGAAHLLQDINSLNAERTDAGLFLYTEGKEIENYLPEAAIWYAVEAVWKGYASHSEKLRGTLFKVGRYESYSDALWRHFTALGVVDQSEDDGKQDLPLGRSLWGSGNKVEMMRHALGAPFIKESDLNWHCSSLLDNISNFVVAKCAG